MKPYRMLNIKALLSCLVLLLSLSPLMATADMYYSIEGKISEINAKSIRLADSSYPFLATLKVIGLDGKPTAVKSLKKGDYVKITILYIDQKRRVDTIARIPDPDHTSSQQ